MIGETMTLISVGFALGLLHALDAAHVMAVSVLGNLRPGVGKILRYSTSWALGHAGVLLASGVLLFGLGLGIPHALVGAAEIGVGLFLVGMGLYCIWQFRRERITFTEHRHGDIVHTHLQAEGNTRHGYDESSGRLGHAPVMVGIMHGLAGSAPALALVPVVAQGELAVALAYLLTFSIGVLLAMLAFGLGYGSAQHWLTRRRNLLQHFRHLIAVASIAVGGYWLSQAI